MTPRVHLLVGGMLAAACATPTRMVPARGATVYEVRDGSWLGPEGFDAGTRYVVNGRLSTSRPASVDSVIDLAGGWVVPPFGEAHNHNVSYTTAPRTDALLARYVHDGVLYAQNPGDVPRGRDSLRGRVNRPGAVDVIFANGLLTATGGHPTGLYLRNRARGGMTESDGDGGFLWLIDSLPDLDRKWSRILAGRPDIIKTVLVHSEEFARRRSDTAFFNWRGLDPALLPEIVHRAHAAGLRVMTHVETATDFRVAVGAGADEIGHVPGFRGDEHEQLPSAAPYEITPADAREAARRGTWVITTLGGISSLDPNGPDSLRRRAFDRLATRNLRVLREAGVRIAIGSDAYRDDSVNEVRYLATLGVLDPLSLLRMWSEATPRAIFPTRRVGCLADGCEASFLVLRGNPAVDFSSTGRIVLRMKDGELIR
jgi:imidazolonepropionase-like amidohydrolase